MLDQGVVEEEKQCVSGFTCVIVNEASVLTWHASLSCTCSTISAIVERFSLQQQDSDTRMHEYTFYIFLNESVI